VFPKEKPTSLRTNELFLEERPKFFRETYVPIFLTIIIISFLFLYKLAIYHCKGFNDNYNFVVENILIIIHIQKLWSHKILDTFAHKKNMVVPLGNLNPSSFEHMVVPQGNLNFLSFNCYSKNHMLWIFQQSQSFHFLYIRLRHIIKRFQGKVQLYGWKHLNWNSYAKIMITQSFKHICSPKNVVS